MLKQLNYILFLCLASCYYQPPSPSIDRNTYVKMIDKGILHLRNADKYFRQKGVFVEEDLKRARAVFQKASELRPLDPESYDGLGAVEIRLGSKDIALAHFFKAIELNPQYGRAYVHLAFISELDGRIEESKYYLEKAREISPLDKHALGNLGSLVLNNTSLKVNREVGEMYLLQSEELESK